LDSGVLLAELAGEFARVVPLYVRAGHLWEDAEAYWLGRFVRALKDTRVCGPEFVSLPMDDVYGRHWSVSGDGVPGHDAALEANYLPGRNLILLAKAAVFCALRGIETLALAPLKENPFSDATERFFRSFEETVAEALRGAGAPLRVVAPFRTLGKDDVIRRGRLLPLELTFSCAKPAAGMLHCGLCTKCAERRGAFARAGLLDPTRYESTP
jgi:7-cyano-7-deazaguanine synthase